MKIVLVGGVKKAKYLIEKFNNSKNKIVFITKDEMYGRYIDRYYGIDVYIGNGTDPMVLENAGVSDFDLMITLCPQDEDNLVACRLGKTMNIKRTLSVINSPANEDIFRQLKVDTTISVANILGMIIEKNAFTSDVDTLLPIENGKAVILEIEIDDDKFDVEGKKISSINIPKEAIIGCIVRNEDAVIPRGDTVIEIGDKLIIITLDDVKEKVIKVLSALKAKGGN